MKLTIAMIVKDEEELLQRCIDSLPRDADELLIVDTGSTDNTIEIAAAAGATVHRIEWSDDFAAARNYAERLIPEGEYVYWQDADEILVAGADRIVDVARKGEEDGVKPTMIWQRDESGAIAKSYPRQELLHRVGMYKWVGARHEALVATDACTPPAREDRGIQIEQIPRTGGDRAYGDPFAPLRPAKDERGLFYLAREHWYAKHYHEAIGLVDVLLEAPAEWPIQRSHAATVKADCLKALGQMPQARQTLLRAIEEYGAWAEPYFALGWLHYELGQWYEGAGWFAAAAAMPRPTGYFVDDDVYDWKRYDLLAVCLFRTGDIEAARFWGQRAIAARPGDQRLIDNMAFYREPGRALGWVV